MVGLEGVAAEAEVMVAATAVAATAAAAVEKESAAVATAEVEVVMVVVAAAMVVVEDGDHAAYAGDGCAGCGCARGCAGRVCAGRGCAGCVRAGSGDDATTTRRAADAWLSIWMRSIASECAHGEAVAGVGEVAVVVVWRSRGQRW